MDYDKAASDLELNGFAVIEDFLTEEEVNDLKQRMKEILDDLDPAEHQTVFLEMNNAANDYFMKSADRISFFFEEGAKDKAGNLTVDKHLSVNKIGHALHCHDPVFSRITLSEKMKEMTRKAIKFTDPVICQSMYIFKQPNIGGEVLPHQDSQFTNTIPKRLVGIWIPLEDAHKGNSCLWAIPGSHKGGVHNNCFLIRNPEPGPGKPELVFTADRQKYEDSDFVPIEMKAGSLLLLHGEVVHKSEPNTSTRSRHAYSFHLFENEGVEYSKQNWLQPTSRNTFYNLYEAKA